MNSNELMGRYRARAVDCALGETGKGSEQVAIAFEIVEDGPALGFKITWYGYFSEKAFESTIKALRVTGWQGTDLNELADFATASLVNEVELVIEQEEQQDEAGNPAGTRARVRWVNAPGSIAVKQRLDPLKAKDLATRMKGAILAFDSASKSPSTSATRAAPARAATPSGRSTRGSSGPNPPPHTDSDMPPF